MTPVVNASHLGYGGTQAHAIRVAGAIVRRLTRLHAVVWVSLRRADLIIAAVCLAVAIKVIAVIDKRVIARICGITRRACR